MPDFPLIDAHIHLYDSARLSYSWMQQAPALLGRHLLPEFDAACDAVQVEKVVFVEVAADPGLHLDEAGFIDGLAREEPRIAAMVAHAPLEKGAFVEADLVALAEHKSLRGIRRLIQSEADPAFCLEPDFIAGVRLLAKYGLSFDLCIKHWQMTHAIELVRRCPEVIFILDHIGKPGIRFGFREPWWSELRELAFLPNVYCKMSGVITEADPNAWTPQIIRPYVEHVIACFGFGRTMFGSDWTVSTLTHPYPLWIEILDEILHGCSDAELRAFYRDTAAKAYRLDG
ncbi:amidohydrolase family protein [Methylovirgula sp. 4M-Z18]|uniref:amidohydrolase family protein n=1 Tax=Methylovirgula sp. 4M-Z18 TaxID=2293567 RepID=UPI0013147280|nr:amidohydrolase family protein [Methylovirgula sp. 4M-Z18]